MPQDVTLILSEAANGDPTAAERLLPIVYDELRRLAGALLQNERAGQTLQATALVHEAYLRLVASGGKQQDWQNRRHFFGAAAESMRRILIEVARRKGRLKHGGEWNRVDLADVPDAAPVFREDLEALWNYAKAWLFHEIGHEDDPTAEESG
jgi:RNA polymerase sigma factor (TIGR02999 family)